MEGVAPLDALQVQAEPSVAYDLPLPLCWDQHLRPPPPTKSKAGRKGRPSTSKRQPRARHGHSMVSCEDGQQLLIGWGGNCEIMPDIFMYNIRTCAPLRFTNVVWRRSLMHSVRQARW